MTDWARSRGVVREALLFVLAALPPFVLYVVTLAPSVTSEDSGELITAAYELGIAHPPGYPLWCLLGKLFTFVPFGSVPWRVHLLSAVLGAAAVGFVGLTARELCRRTGPALVGAWVFGASRDFWSQSVIAEVYTLNVLLIVAVVWLLLRFAATNRSRWLYVAAMLIGLGFTNHSTMGPLALLFAGWSIARRPAVLRHPRLLLNLVLATIIGASIFLYMPIRSIADPVMDWGDTESLSALVDHVLRRSYSNVAEPRPRTLASQWAMLQPLLGTYFAQFTPLGGTLALFGVLPLFRRRRGAFWLLFLLFGSTTYGFLWLLNFEPTREQLHLTRVFFLPAWAVASVWLALALRELATRARAWSRAHRNQLPTRISTPASWLSVRTMSRACLAASALLVSAPILSHYRRNDRSGDYLALDWGTSMLESLPTDAIVIAPSDHSTFPLVYLQVVEGLRPDVVIASKYGYYEERLFDQIFEGRETPHALLPSSSEGPKVERFLVESSGRRVFFSTKADSVPPGFELRTLGLLYEAVPEGSAPISEEEVSSVWQRIRLRPSSLAVSTGDYGDDLVIADYYFALGRRHLAAKDAENAVAVFRRAARHARGIESVLNNLGSALAESGNHDEALEFLFEAHRVDPSYSLAILNVALCLDRLQRYEGAVEWFRRAAELRPNVRVFRLGKARAYRADGDFDAALAAYESLLVESPDDPVLRREYTELVENRFRVDSESRLAELERFSPRRKDPNAAKSSPRSGSSDSDLALPSGPPIPDTPRIPDPMSPSPAASAPRGQGWPSPGVSSHQPQTNR
jgi:tetratricopeptide (TPR) repeat protein